MNELVLDADFIRETYVTPPPEASMLQEFGANTAVTSLNGLSGPSVVFDGGTSGFSYSTAAPNVSLNSPLTTKGDLYVRNATAGTRQPVGANDTFLVADSTQATGLKWLAGVSGFGAWTGTADKTTHATYPATTASVGYVQAELQGVMDKLKQITEAYKALEDALLTLKAVTP